MREPIAPLLEQEEPKDAEIAKLKKLLTASENWRQAYQDGKYKLYAMGGEICEAAAEHLPMSEGPLDRAVRKAIGILPKSSPLELQDQLTQALTSLAAARKELQEERLGNIVSACECRTEDACAFIKRAEPAESKLSEAQKETLDVKTNLHDAHKALADQHMTLSKAQQTIEELRGGK